MSLAPEVARVFGLQGMTAAAVRRTTVVRCVDGLVWACDVGADLPCGKANASTVLPAGRDWCSKHPDADFVPAYIEGQDSLYVWRCVHGVPRRDEKRAVDGRGFLMAYWKRLA